MSSLFFSFILFFVLVGQVPAFKFSFNPPSECDDLGVTWTGGKSPFTLHIILVYGSTREVAIPSNAFNNGNGSYSMQLPFKRGEQFLLIMSDATGFNSGGTSNLQTVSQSKGGACNTTDPGTAFVFQLNVALQQCRPFTFSGYEGAVPPVTIGIVVPGGNAFTINPPADQNSYSWPVNAARGTSMIFFMTDSQGRTGGSSDVRSVGASDDSSCLNNQSPTVTSDPPGPSQIVTPTPPPTSPPAVPTPISAAGIAGAIIGSVLFLAVVITLVLFFLKRVTSGSKKRIPPLVDLPEQGSYIRPKDVPSSQTSPYPSSGQFETNSGPYLDHVSSNYTGSHYQAPEVSDSGRYESSVSGLSPPTLYPPQPHAHNPHHSLVSSSTAEDSDIYASTIQPTPNFHSDKRRSVQSSAAQRKAAMAGASSNAPSRFIVHTDAEDVSPPNEDGVIELPPQYTERRAPIRLDPPEPLPYDIEHPS